MKPRLRFWTAAMVFAVLAGIGYGWLYIHMDIYTVTVANRSAHALTDVRVIVPGRVRTIGTLTPGASGWVYTKAENDGTLDVAFTANGQAKYEKIDYVSSGLGKHYRR